MSEIKKGLKNRTSTFIFLIKYYLLTKKDSLDNSIAILNNLLDKKDTSSLAFAEEQPKDI